MRESDAVKAAAESYLYARARLNAMVKAAEKKLDEFTELANVAAAHHDAETRKGTEELKGQGQMLARHMASLVSSLHPRAVQPFGYTTWIGGYDIGEKAVPEVLRVGSAGTLFGEIPVLLPNPARAHVRIMGDKEAAPAVEQLLVRMLATTPRVRVHILDPHNSAVALSRFGAADTDKGGVFSPSAVTSAMVEASLEEMVRRVQQVHSTFLQGAVATLEEYNRTATIPEPTHVVVALNAETYSQSSLTKLRSLMRNGSASGVNVIQVVGATIGPESDKARQALNEESPYGFNLAFDSEGTVYTYGARKVSLDTGLPTSLVHRVVQEAEAAARNSKQSLSLTHILSKKRERPGNDLRAVIGRAGTRNVEVSLSTSGELVHMLIGGATGSGKSTLLHSLICSLASRYSPEDLNFYLVDGKQGVEMRNYAPLPTSPAWPAHLPHVKVAAVKSDIRMYISVLTELQQEINRRGKLVGHNGVSKVSELPQEIQPPRIVAVLDEFQVLLTDPVHSGTASKLLENVARQGRAYGVHLVLATQTLAGLQPKSTNAGLFQQIKTRIALSCDKDVSEKVLGEGNFAAAKLTDVGQAILNETGQENLNIQFQVGYLTSEERAETVRTLHTEAIAAGTIVAEPVVFAGDELPRIVNGPILGSFSALAEQAPKASTRLWLGMPTEVSGPVGAPLSRSSSGHLLVMGAGDFESSDIAGTLTAAALSAAAAHRSGRYLIVLPGEEHEQYGTAQHLIEALRSAGIQAEALTPGAEATGTFEDLAAEAKTAAEARETLAQETFVVVFDGDGTIEKGALAPLAAAGATGIHLLAAFASRKALVESCLSGSVIAAAAEKAYALFDVRLYAQVSAPDQGTLGLPGKYRPEEERMTLWSRNRPNSMSVILPYQAPTSSEWEQIIEGLKMVKA